MRVLQTKGSYLSRAGREGACQLVVPWLHRSLFILSFVPGGTKLLSSVTGQRRYHTFCCSAQPGVGGYI